MKIHFLGTGTSQGIPVIGCKCEVCMSANPRDKRLRTSVYVEWEGGHVQIDCGPDFRQQMLRAGIDDLHHILITHEHMDHIAGLDDIRPFNFRSEMPITLYGSSRVIERLQTQFFYIFDSKPYPGAPRITPVVIDRTPFDISGMCIQAIPVVHGQWPVLGFRLDRFAYITDVNHIPEESLSLLQDLDVLVLGVLHRKVHHAHYHLEKGIEIARQIGARQCYFTHISHTMGLYDQTQKELPAGIDLAHDGLTIELSAVG